VNSRMKAASDPRPLRLTATLPESAIRFVRPTVRSSTLVRRRFRWRWRLRAPACLTQLKRNEIAATAKAMARVNGTDTALAA